MSSPILTSDQRILAAVRKALEHDDTIISVKVTVLRDNEEVSSLLRPTNPNIDRMKILETVGQMAGLANQRASGTQLEGYRLALKDVEAMARDYGPTAKPE